MNLLFVCSANKLRSPTGEEVFSKYSGINAIGAGTNHDAETAVSGDLIEWADVIFVMEKSHRKRISSKFNKLLKNKRMICLGIPDNYKRMDPALVKILEVKVAQHVHIR